MKKILVSLRVPKGENAKISKSQYCWNKKGGHAGSKMISKVVANAEAEGWKQKSNLFSETPDGSNLSKGTIYLSPCGNFEMIVNSRYGVTADYNSFLIIINLLEPKN